MWYVFFSLKVIYFSLNVLCFFSLKVLYFSLTKLNKVTFFSLIYQQKSAILAKRIKKKKIFVKRKLKGAYIRKEKNINNYSVSHAWINQKNSLADKMVDWNAAMLVVILINRTSWNDQRSLTVFYKNQ